ncbi:MAG: hypothetical protein AB1753_00535 [Thermoproteota archaeon]
MLDNSRQVLLNGKTIRISPIELQIAYKLFLSTDKDIEEMPGTFTSCSRKSSIRTCSKVF